MSSVGRVGLSLGAVALLLASAAFGSTYLGLAAPASGALYETVDRGGTRIENPYGEASVWYDDEGVPHISAENEQALYFAVGYVQARDRLFEMDIQRRLVGGNLSAAVGERALESDRFYRQMDFRGAAEASWTELQDGDVGPSIRAYSAGVNRYVDTGDLPPEFALLDYRPKRWTPVDTLLVGKQISWTLSGSFADLERATVRDRLGPEAMDLYPAALGHDAPIIRGDSDAAAFDPAATIAAASASENETAAADVTAADYAALYDAVDDYDYEPGTGSNNWVVSGNYTASGSPVLANDPHLSLTVPAVWYEMHLRVDGGVDGGSGGTTGTSGNGAMDVRGVTFPGIPYVIIGRTDDVAWGVTNVGGDFTDLYTYETRGDRYRYDGEFREFDTTNVTVPVADGEDATVEVRKSVHGPVIERGGETVGVAWPGFSATNESLGVYRLNHADSVDDVKGALRIWDVPAQNFVAADRDGRTLYYPAGRYPLRVTDGDVVRGDRIFDGSAGEGEWVGYEPYGTSTWSGFVPFDSIPHLDDPGYVASANQRTVDDPGFYVGTSTTYADPYRAARIYDLLDRRAESGEPMDAAYMERIQRDVRSEAAVGFTPYALDAREKMSPAARRAADRLDGRNRTMRADSEAALVYGIWLEEFRNATFADEFGAAGLDSEYYPKHYVLQTLPADSEWFDDRTTRATETREDVAARAMERAVDRIEREGYETYGDYNRLELTHPFDQAFLNFPTRPMNGSQFTVFNFRAHRSTQVGSSWRMVVSFADESPSEDRSVGIVPGGQSGVFWSDHYADQLDRWADGEYKPLTMAWPDGKPDIVFVDDDAADGSESTDGPETANRSPTNRMAAVAPSDVARAGGLT